MTAIEIARKLAGLGQAKEACQAYGLALHENDEQDPALELEAAAYILQNGGDYKVSYTCFRDLYNRGCFQEQILPLMTAVFYEPNEKIMRTRYERNCKLLEKYPYIFRRDFPAFEDLPIQFFPYDEHNGYIPFYHDTMKFGDFVNFSLPKITQNFFKDLRNPILAENVFSQYELEYLNDNVRKSEYVAKENHVYVHYSNWMVFCSYLQCLNFRVLLEDEKFVFLIEEEVEKYPIDFAAEYGIDYSQNPVRPIGLREINRIIWHTQLSTHNGGDFFNEVFDDHPNLLALTSIMFDSIEDMVESWRKSISNAKASKESLEGFVSNFDNRGERVIRDLCRMQNPSDKDIFVAFYLADSKIAGHLDPAERIAPVVFFQPHFSNIVYNLEVDKRNNTMLASDQYEKTATSPVFRGFKYIKTFTPMRRFTTSHGATVKFMYNSALEDMKERQEKVTSGVGATGPVSVVADAVTQRILNRSFMIDWQDRLYQDCVQVRLEDGKLNPKATFMALCEFLDLPYTESMTYCSEFGKPLDYTDYGISSGFDTASVYKTYDEFVNDSERKYIEFFLRDAYEYFGYDFHYYDGQPLTEEELDALTEDFSTIDRYLRETWINVYKEAGISVNGQRAAPEVEQQLHEQLLENQIQAFHENRKANTRILLRGLRFLNRNGQPLHMMPKLKLDPALLEQPLYH